MGISGVGSFPSWSGGSLIIFKLLRCRNLALNRVFSLLFVEAGMFYTWGCLDAPTFIHTPIHLYAPRGVHPPYIPLLLCAYVCSQRLLNVVGGCKGPLHVDTSPCMRVHSHMFTCTHSLASLCISMFWGYLHVIWGIFPLCWGFGGVPPSVWGFWGINTWGVHIPILVVHYVLCFYYGHDYYYSSYGGVFWAVICFISDCGSFPDGASLQHWISMKWFNHQP